jgi:hypothetical protein
MAFERDDVIRLFVTGEKGEHLELCPDPDAPDFGVLLHTPDEKSQKFFGSINLILSPDECKTLGDALVEFSSKFKSS